MQALIDAVSAALGAVLDALADLRHRGKAVGITDPLHAMSELAQLLEIGRGECGTQGLELLLPVLEEHGDQVCEVFGDGDGEVGAVIWWAIIGGLPPSIPADCQTPS